MFVTIINDCRDANAFGRQATRVATLLSCPVSTAGVQNDIEASGMLVDILDASLEKEGVILVNVAPREKTKNKWENGTPFGYFSIGNTIVCTSIAGETLRLVYELGITNSIEVCDIPEVMKSAEKQKLVTKKDVEHIVHTQFRSYEFLPRIAAWLTQKHWFPTHTLNLAKQFSSTQPKIWWIDCFGNCKTSLVSSKTKGKINTKFGTFPLFSRLTDVPDHTVACVKGSSGYGEKRFLEIVVQGGNAAKKLGIESGNLL